MNKLKLIILILIVSTLAGCVQVENLIATLVDPKVVNEEPELDDPFEIAPEYLTTDGVLVYDEEEIEETDMTVEYKGEIITYDPDYNKGDDSPILVIMFRQRSLIPLRELANKLGYKIEWEGAGQKQTLYIRGNDLEIETRLNSNDFYIRKDGKVERVYSETPVVMYNSKIYVPTRFIGETLGVQVEWINDQNKVVITNERSTTND